VSNQRKTRKRKRTYQFHFPLQRLVLVFSRVGDTFLDVRPCYLLIGNKTIFASKVQTIASHAIQALSTLACFLFIKDGKQIKKWIMD
jgi:hypothetical protein